MKIGLLGASKIAVEAVIKPAQLIPSVEISCIGARDLSRAKDYAKTHNIEIAFGSYEEVVKAVDIDLIYIALPPSHHAHWATKALEAGKHVLCEKPFAMNAEEAKHVTDIADKNGRRVIEAFHYSHHPAFHTFMEWIRGNKIGEITSIKAQFSAPIVDDGVDVRFRPTLGGGAMMDLGCYPLHWIRTVMGSEPVFVSAEAKLADSGVDEKMTAQLQFPNDVSASFITQVGKGAPLTAFLNVTGSKGEIKFFNPLAPQMGSELKLLVGDGVDSAPISPLTTYTYQLADVVRALTYKLPMANEGAATIVHQNAMDAVYRAAGLSDLRKTAVDI